MHTGEHGEQQQSNEVLGRSRASSNPGKYDIVDDRTLVEAKSRGVGHTRQEREHEADVPTNRSERGINSQSRNSIE